MMQMTIVRFSGPIDIWKVSTLDTCVIAVFLFASLTLAFNWNFSCTRDVAFTMEENYFFCYPQSKKGLVNQLPVTLLNICLHTPSCEWRSNESLDVNENKRQANRDIKGDTTCTSMHKLTSNGPQLQVHINCYYIRSNYYTVRPPWIACWSARYS